MHEVIICEKPKASEKIASALSKKRNIKKFHTMNLRRMVIKQLFFLR